MLKRSALSIVWLLTLSIQTAIADGMFEGGAPQRPTAFTDVLIDGTTYNVDITHITNGGTNPIRVGDLPDLDISLARAALLIDLNDGRLERALLFIYFLPNHGPLDELIGAFERHGRIVHHSRRSRSWPPLPVLLQRPSVSTTHDNHEFPRPPADPEPSSFFICVGLVGLGMFGRSRR